MGGSGCESDKRLGSAAGEHSEFGEYSSPPCFMHELDQNYLGLSGEGKSSSPAAPPSPGLDWPSVRQWRKETRVRLIDQRMRIPSQMRADWSERISQGLKTALAASRGKLIGFYWPFKGEYDARPLLMSLRDQGTRLALPVVVEKAHPLQFREWWPGMPMSRGVWNIPIPSEGEAVIPEVLIAPLVGFDPAGYRLGYGGGFYDRTIAAMPTKPLAIGVGFELARVATIYPQAHDMPMDVIVTEGRR